MIKKASVHALIALSSLLASVSASYAAPVTDGTIQFNGKVVDAGCAVATGSINQTIEMGQVSTTILKVAGDTSNTTDIPIVLEDCDTDTSKVVQVIFSGASVPGDTTVLAVGSDINAATNVGIKLYDSQNTEINLEELTPAVTLSPGENTLHFTAKYYALGKSTAGEANATATFTMIYP